MPILFLKNMAGIMSSTNVTKEFIEFGYDPESKFGKKTKAQIAKKQSMLKPIDS